MHSPKAMTPFAGQFDNIVWVKRLCLQPGMQYKKRWHDMIASLASIWNNSLEKAWGKAASPCWSNQPPPFGQSIADSLACVYLLAHVVFRSSSKHIQQALQWRFHCKSMTSYGIELLSWFRTVPHPLWHPLGLLAKPWSIALSWDLCPLY